MNPPPVYLEGEGALLPDGRFIPEVVLRRTVEVVMEACRFIESLPPETRLALEVESAFAALEDGAA